MKRLPLLFLAALLLAAPCYAQNYVGEVPVTRSDRRPYPGDTPQVLLQKLLLQALDNSSGSATPSRTAQGGFFAPTASTNGTELANRPAANATSGFRFELNSGASITYYVLATGQTPSAPPAYAKTVNVAGTTDEPLSGTDSIYVTSVSGTVIGRWVQR